MAKKKDNRLPESEEWKLTARQESFCQHYSYLLNGAEAARLSGYSENTAREIASENLTKPSIQARIAELRVYAGKKYNITREMLIQEYAKLIRFDIRKIFNEDGSLVDITSLGDDEAAAIMGVEISKDFLGTTEFRKVKIADRRNAMDSLRKMLGFDEVTKMELAGPDGTPLHPDIDLSKYSDDELIALAELQRKGRVGTPKVD